MLREGIIPTFRYSARLFSGELVTGDAAAPTQELLAKDLLEKGQVLVKARRSGGQFSIGQMGFRRKMAVGSQLAFLRQLLTLSKSGQPLAKAFAMLEAAQDEPLLKTALSGIRTQISSGVALDDAIEAHPEVFSPIIASTVRAGILSGKLEMALGHLIAYLELRRDLERKLKRALAYPVFLVIMLIVVLSIILLFVLPRFSELYADFGAELPLLTRGLIFMADIAPVLVPGLLAAGVAIFFSISIWLRYPSVRLRYDQAKLKWPLFGQLARNEQLAQISFTFSLMLSAGMHLREVIRQVASNCQNSFLQKKLEQLENVVVEGHSLSDGLRSIDLYPDLSLSLLVAGESSGNVGPMFQDVAKLHSDILEDRLGQIITLIEPAMMVIVGAVLGTVIIAIYLPIFGISQVIH